MLRLEEVIQLKNGEEVRMVAKRHAATIIPGLFWAFLFIVIPFFFLFPLFSSGPAGAVVFLVVILTGLIIAWRTFLMWDGDALVITTHRLVKVLQTGIFARTVNEVPLTSVAEVSWSKKGMFGHFLNYGVIRIMAGHEMVIKKIAMPQKLHALIMELTELAKRVHVTDNQLRDHRIAKIQKMLQDLDDRTLREIEQVLVRGGRADGIQQALFHDVMPTTPNVVHAAPLREYSSPQDGSYPESEEEEDAEVRIKTLFGEDRTTKLKLMDE
jgi:uncharacterized membrane protein YdbT with pleckstrin-like domain